MGGQAGSTSDRDMAAQRWATGEGPSGLYPGCTAHGHDGQLQTPVLHPVPGGTSSQGQWDRPQSCSGVCIALFSRLILQPWRKRLGVVRGQAIDTLGLATGNNILTK